MYVMAWYSPGVSLLSAQCIFWQSLLRIHIGFSVFARLWQSVPQVIKCLSLSRVPGTIADDPNSCTEKSDQSVPFTPFLLVNGIPKSSRSQNKESWCAVVSVVAAAACFDHPCFFLWTFPNEGPKLVYCMEGQACHWWAVSGKSVLAKVSFRFSKSVSSYRKGCHQSKWTTSFVGNLN